MRRIDILLASELTGGLAPFRHDDFEVVLHRWTDFAELPLIEGALWIFIDWVLPEMSGLELCRRLRADAITSHAHVTIVLEEDNVEDRKRALRMGADDYMVGPLTRNALLDRVLGASVSEQDSAGIRVVAQGELTVDLAAFQARWQGKPISLMPNELRLLRYFIEHPGRVFTRTQLIAALGKQEPPVDERTVDVWIGRLRRALKGVGAGNPLRTVRSLGYVFDTL
ncbi:MULTISPECIES: response regulator transcription factor [Novosphingobium]|uniref:Two-component system, OmpR family, phosphate regulon response regulator PhoB n=1 Tax=Novosphingobium mathurense TaxID=428990 RepID=A0A1U6IAU4_9SPHN|nr:MULTISPECIES: response regulator transcription factor [Novosphingobium]CDO34346.1 Two component transcriptional regulator, winged helix family [Novosphingobium sp. KN65.2]SLK05131.1 two-component system, OmpR family, phosphate regulon response regulator PhoB [Novosphingobium mathurense]